MSDLIPDNTPVIFKHGFDKPRSPAARMKPEYDGAIASVVRYYDDDVYLIRFTDGHEMLAGFEELTTISEPAPAE